MAGYEYRGTDSRRRRAEEFTRRRDAAEAARKRRAANERAARRSAKPATQTAPAPKPEETPMPKLNDSPAATVKPPVGSPGGEFDVVREDPPARAGARTGAVAAAARSAVSVLVDSPGEWVRVAHRDTRAKASAYASTLRGLDHRVETRTAPAADGKGGVLYARITPNTRGEKK